MIGAGFVTAVLLGACTGNLLQSGAVPTKAQLATSNRGIAVLMMGIENKPCLSSTIIIGETIDGGYRAKHTVAGPSGAKGQVEPVQLTLDAGTYHIVGWHCETSRYRRKIGHRKKALISFAPLYLKSYASFTIAAEEIVNLGYLRMEEIGKRGALRFTVIDLPASARAWLAGNRPQIYWQMITRAMQLAAAAPRQSMTQSAIAQ